MSDSVSTRPSLLIRVRNPADDAAWRQFVGLYAPLVYGFARRRGLQDADAADVVQDVLQQAAGAVQQFQYDPEQGTFRSWLFRVVRNRLSVWLRKQRAHDRGSGDSGMQSLLEQEPANDEESESWDHDYERQLFGWAAKQIRGDFEPTNWAAFWQTAVDGKSPAEVAERLKISVGKIYVAKSRILARLRQKIQELEE